MFYRYLQEYNRLVVNKKKRLDCPLEISLEDRLSVVDQYFEVYEPQDNDGIIALYIQYRCDNRREIPKDSQQTLSSHSEY